MTKKSTQECPVPAGILVIIGGKVNKGKKEAEGRKSPPGFIPLEILQRFADLAGKDDPAHI